MTQSEVMARAREALRCASWARRAGWGPIAALYLADVARWRRLAVMMRRCGMPVLPHGMSVMVKVTALPPF